MYSIPQIAPSNLRRSPASFLSTRKSRAWLDELADAYPHERFTRSRSDSFSAKECNGYASTILRAKRAGEDPDAALEDHFCGAAFQYTWSEYVRPDLETFLERHGKRDTDKWTDAIRYEWEERAEDADRSRASDLFDSHDRCELLFALTPTAGLEDHLIYSHKPWSEPAELSISPDLQFALNQIGYSINEFRRMSGNQHEATEKLHAKRPRRNPIVSQEKLTSIIANACSSMFNFYLFAIVPMTDLIKIDLSKPMTISPCWLASMNPLTGTFFEEPLDVPITIEPGDGHLLTGDEVAYSPDDICGLYRPHFHASLENLEPQAGQISE